MKIFTNFNSKGWVQMKETVTKIFPRFGLASYPGLPMFFNISRKKLGRPGRSGDVMDVVWDAVSSSLPTHPRNLLHIEKLARTEEHVSITTTKGVWD